MTGIFMKKTLLASFLEEYVQMTPREVKNFIGRAERNPFSRQSKDLAARVRNDPHLDKTSRALVGYDSGVFGSQYDDMVRDIDDLDIYDDEYEYDDDDDRVYIDTTDPNYKRNEFDDELDALDIDMDVGKEFMAMIRAKDDEFDDEEFDDEDDDQPLFAEYDPDEDEEDDEDDLSDEEFDRLLNSSKDDDSELDLDDEDELDSDEEYSDDEEDFDSEEETESKYEGVVRAVKGAYLVSKKRQPDETFTEVWMYNVGQKYDDEANIRKSILSYTDIDPAKNFSEDGSQEVNLKTVGNVQFLTITGLPD